MMRKLNKKKNWRFSDRHMTKLSFSALIQKISLICDNCEKHVLISKNVREAANCIVA